MSADIDLPHFTFRLVQDAINERTRAYWIRRAELFEAAMPTEADFFGQADSLAMLEQKARVEAKAQACRNRAELCEMSEEEQQLALDLIARNLGEVAA